MKQQLDMKDRVTITTMLPLEANYSTLLIVQKLRETIGITEEDYKEYDITEKDGKISWNAKGNAQKEFDIGEKATDIIVDALEKLDKDKKLTIQHMSLYEKFVKRRS